jgi:hypothetical protein
VRGLFLARLKSPGEYATKPTEALTLFCAHYLEVLRYQSAVQMLRVSIAETARFPEGAAQHFDVMFTQVETRLATYLKSTFALGAKASAEAAQRLLAQILFPFLPRALFGLEPLHNDPDGRPAPPKADLRPIRKAVAELLASLPANA